MSKIQNNFLDKTLRNDDAPVLVTTTKAANFFASSDNSPKTLCSSLDFPHFSVTLRLWWAKVSAGKSWLKLNQKRAKFLAKYHRPKSIASLGGFFMRGNLFCKGGD